MTVTLQLVLGSLMLCLCSLIHIGILVLTAYVLRWIDQRLDHLSKTWDAIAIVVAAYLLIVLGHSIQVWLWAWSFVHTDALRNMPDALYFSLITYTTVGYGDIVLEPDLRMFATMAAVTGVLNFGLSAAFLVALMNKFFVRMNL